MTAFYSVPLRRCDICQKPATKQIMGSGNVLYSFVCDKHEKPRIASLTKAYSAPSTPTQEESQ